MSSIIASDSPTIATAVTLPFAEKQESGEAPETCGHVQEIFNPTDDTQSIIFGIPSTKSSRSQSTTRVWVRVRVRVRVRVIGFGLERSSLLVHFCGSVDFAF